MRTEEAISDEIYDLKQCRLRYSNLRVIFEQFQDMERRNRNPEDIYFNFQSEFNKHIDGLIKCCVDITNRCSDLEFIYKGVLEDE
jgi:hypothetical protein